MSCIMRSVSSLRGRQRLMNSLLCGDFKELARRTTWRSSLSSSSVRLYVQGGRAANKRASCLEAGSGDIRPLRTGDFE